VKRKIED